MPVKRGRPKGSRIFAFDAVRNEYEDLVTRGLAVPDIHRELVQRHGANRAPALRNLYRWVGEDRSIDRSGPWRLWMTDTDDVPLVFRTIDAVIERTSGRVRWVSASEAEWIVRIGKLGADVGLNPFDVYAQARRSARSNARDPEDYVEDVTIGILTDRLSGGVLDLGSAKDLREWVERGR